MQLIELKWRIYKKNFFKTYNMKYKIWAVTYITEKEDNGVKTYIKEKVKKEFHNGKYLFEADSLKELRADLIEKKGCNRVEFSYDSEL